MITGINRPIAMVDPLCAIIHAMMIDLRFLLLRSYKLAMQPSEAPTSLRELGIH
jgi:hypothetical protein